MGAKIETENSHRVWKKSYLQLYNKSSDENIENINSSLKEITLRMCRVNAPPVVNENVENGQDNNEKRSRPLSLESNGNHPASPKADQRHDEPGDGPLTLNHKPKEKENEEDTTYKLKAADYM